MAISVRDARVGAARGTGRGDYRGGGARFGARRTVPAGAAVDTVLLALCTLTALVLLFLPGETRERAAAALRRTVVAPFAALQSAAEVQRAKYLSYDDRAQERGALARDAADVSALRAENDRLRRLLALGARLQWGFVVAEALPSASAQVGRALVRTQILESFLITKGGRAGLAPFAPVVAPNGLVGMVERVDPAMSTAISYAHPDFRASAQTPDGAAFGIVQAHLGGGADRGLLEMRGVAFRSALKAGQPVVTSGLGATYPAGIPIGTVVREIQTPERWARTYLVQPAVDVGDMGAVMVLMQRRVTAGVDSAWTAITSDSVARGIAAAGDSIAREALAREAAARRAALDSAPPGAGADSGATPPAAPAVAPRATAPATNAPAVRDSTAPRPASARAAPAATPRRDSARAAARPASRDSGTRRDPSPDSQRPRRPTVPRPTVPGPATTAPPPPRPAP